MQPKLPETPNQKDIQGSPENETTTLDPSLAETLKQEGITVGDFLGSGSLVRATAVTLRDGRSAVLRELIHPEDEGDIASFRKEMQLYWSVDQRGNHIKHIPRFHRAFAHGGGESTTALIVGRAPGVELEDLLREGERFTELQQLAILNQTSRFLSDLYRHGWVFPDMKGNALFVDTSGGPEPIVTFVDLNVIRPLEEGTDTKKMGLVYLVKLLNLTSGVRNSRIPEGGQIDFSTAKKSFQWESLPEWQKLLVSLCTQEEGYDHIFEASGDLARISFACQHLKVKGKKDDIWGFIPGILEDLLDKGSVKSVKRAAMIDSAINSVYPGFSELGDPRDFKDLPSKDSPIAKAYMYRDLVTRIRDSLDASSPKREHCLELTRKNDFGNALTEMHLLWKNESSETNLQTLRLLEWAQAVTQEGHTINGEDIVKILTRLENIPEEKQHRDELRELLLEISNLSPKPIGPAGPPVEGQAGDLYGLWDIYYELSSKYWELSGDTLVEAGNYRKELEEFLSAHASLRDWERMSKSYRKRRTKIEPAQMHPILNLAQSLQDLVYTYPYSQQPTHSESPLSDSELSSILKSPHWIVGQNMKAAEEEMTGIERLRSYFKSYNPFSLFELERFRSQSDLSDSTRSSNLYYAMVIMKYIISDETKNCTPEEGIQIITSSKFQQRFNTLRV